MTTTTTARPLTGAAKRSHEDKILKDRARARLADRDADAVSDTVTLLRQVVAA